MGARFFLSIGVINLFWLKTLVLIKALSYLDHGEEQSRENSRY